MKGKNAEVFIQYKGTDICLDFHCPCNDSGIPLHFDGYFAYALKCPACGTLYEMPTTLSVKAVDPSKFERDSVVEPT